MVVICLLRCWIAVVIGDRFETANREKWRKFMRDACTWRLNGSIALHGGIARIAAAAAAAAAATSNERACGACFPNAGRYFVFCFLVLMWRLIAVY